MRHTKFEMAFPCDFPLKVIGGASAQFESVVLAIVGEHVQPVSKEAYTIAKSQGGKYLSMTIKLRAESRQQLDNLYRALTASPEVLMAL